MVRARPEEEHHRLLPRAVLNTAGKAVLGSRRYTTSTGHFGSARRKALP